MMIQSRQRLDLLQMALGLRTVVKDRDEEEVPRPRTQPNAFSDLLNTQYAQAASILPKPAEKTRVTPKPPAKREQPSRDRRGESDQRPGQQRLSARV